LINDNLDNYTENDLRWIQSSKPTIENLEQVDIGVKYPEIVDIKIAAADRKKIEETFALIDWLQRNDITRINMPAIDVKTCSLSQHQELLKQFGIETLDETIKKHLLYFIRQKSILCEAIFKKRCQSIGVRCN